MKKWNVWVKWLGSDLQVEKSFDTKQEAENYLKDLEFEQKKPLGQWCNYMGGFVATNKDYEQVSNLFPEDF